VRMKDDVVVSDDAVLLAPGEGEAIGERIRIKCDRDELVITETVGATSTNPHVHDHHADVFWMIEGDFTVLLGDEEFALEPGDFALVPPGMVHCFRSEGGRWLNLHAPGAGFGEYLRSGADFDDRDPAEGDERRPSEGLLRRRGEGEHLALGPAGDAWIKAGEADGTASLAVIEFDIAPGFAGPVPHRHERMTDSFWVLDGTLTLLIGDETHEVGAGSYGYVPPGNVHTFSNPGDEPVRALNVMAPGGLERYLGEVASALRPGEAPDPAEMARIASRYDFVPV
jgi:mannose-6-phosphate isomerase-like protein (cupin superfamily)